jgi:hypothetical protein
VNFLEAVARQEGFNVLGTRPRRNNNPGDIEYGRFARAHGATGTDGRFAIFPTAEAGFAAMRALFVGAYRGLTVRQAIEKWAPSNENDTDLYVRRVVEWTNLTPDSIIDEHLGV